MHNLSFWDEPDWRRESTLNPNFLMGVVIALFLIAALAVASIAYSSSSSLEGRLSALQAQNQRIADQAQEVRTQKEKLNLWNEVLARLEQMERQRFVISRQLEALYEAVAQSPEIQFETLEMHIETVQVEGAEGKGNGQGNGKGQKETKVRYAMSLNGFATGEGAQQIITEFWKRLRPGGGEADSVIRRLMGNTELKGITGVGDENVKNFSIVCTYKPIE